MPSDARSPEDVRRRIQEEREELARAVGSLRAELQHATDVAKKVAPVPVLAAGALAAGFVLAGGIGATVRLLFRRGREDRTRATVGRFRIVERG